MSSLLRAKSGWPFLMTEIGARSSPLDFLPMLKVSTFMLFVTSMSIFKSELLDGSQGHKFDIEMTHFEPFSTVIVLFDGQQSSNLSSKTNTAYSNVRKMKG